MVATPNPKNVKYRRTTPAGAGRYEVLYRGEVIGVVGRLGYSAGQFGSRWVATTPQRKKSGQHMTRDAAAAWLVKQA